MGLLFLEVQNVEASLQYLEDVKQIFPGQCYQEAVFHAFSGENR